jgi:lipopolysaccharide biosynthesis protein
MNQAASVLHTAIRPFHKAGSWLKWRIIHFVNRGRRIAVRMPRSKVDFDDWTERGSGRRAAGFPDNWRRLISTPLPEPARVAVVMHVHYYELVDQLVSALGAIPVPFDLFVTYTGSQAPVIDRTRLRTVGHVIVLPVDNLGRDIAPLIQVVNASLLDPYLLVLKVHTKKSQWRESHSDLAGDGEQWRDAFVTSLVGSTDRIAEILTAFAADPTLGLVTAPGNVLGPEFWGSNLELTRELLRRMEIKVDAKNLKFAAGSMYWVRGFILQGLRSLSMTTQDFDRELGQPDGTTAHAVERAIGVLTEEAGLRLADIDALPQADHDAVARFDTSPLAPRARVVPFYLPQFHPFEENDTWWGKGFTEWTNVTAALPVFIGHNQPKLAGELGYYDLRLDEIRVQQLTLATEHGIEGFMYYYYWFAGKRLMSMPIEKLVESDIQKSFCIMWANENWTRRWDGRTEDILIAQAYDTVPAEDFINDVMEFLVDERYLRVDGKPVLAVYRLGQLPDPARVVSAWRTRARAAGVGELLILSVDVAQEFDGVGAGETLGIDGTLGFPPHNIPVRPGPARELRISARFSGNLMSYDKLVADALQLGAVKGPQHFPGVMVGFDNTARRQWTSDIWWGANPYTFHRWLLKTVESLGDRPEASRLVFINAWNEWAEAAVLEPTARHGRSYLQAVRNVVFS